MVMFFHTTHHSAVRKFTHGTRKGLIPAEETSVGCMFISESKPKPSLCIQGVRTFKTILKQRLIDLSCITVSSTFSRFSNTISLSRALSRSQFSWMRYASSGANCLIDNHTARKCFASIRFQQSNTAASDSAWSSSLTPLSHRPTHKQRQLLLIQVQRHRHCQCGCISYLYKRDQHKLCIIRTPLLHGRYRCWLPSQIWHIP